MSLVKRDILSSSCTTTFIDTKPGRDDPSVWVYLCHVDMLHLQALGEPCGILLLRATMTVQSRAKCQVNFAGAILVTGPTEGENNDRGVRARRSRQILPVI